MTLSVSICNVETVRGRKEARQITKSLWYPIPSYPSWVKAVGHGCQKLESDTHVSKSHFHTTWLSETRLFHSLFWWNKRSVAWHGPFVYSTDLHPSVEQVWKYQGQRTIFPIRACLSNVKVRLDISLRWEMTLWMIKYDGSSIPYSKPQDSELRR